MTEIMTILNVVEQIWRNNSRRKHEFGKSVFKMNYVFVENVVQPIETIKFVCQLSITDLRLLDSFALTSNNYCYIIF